MIKYFVLDLDGCVAHPFQTPDWKAITAIRNLQKQSERNDHIPALSLCTGRPHPYAEAVAQWLGIRDIIIFESGGGFYHPVTNKLTWSPHFTEEIKRKTQEIRSWFSKEIGTHFPGIMLEFTKYTDVGIIHTDENEIRQVFEIASRKISEHYPDFEVHNTGISVNIIVKACNKASGLQYFAEQLRISPEEIAFIGDSSGDVSALEWVGAPFAPNNAIQEVRQRANVMNGKATNGVLEAYQTIIGWNKDIEMK